MDSWWKKSRRTWKIQFLKYLFPCSDRLDQKCLWKLPKNLDWNPSNISSPFFAENSDLAATAWHLVDFWKKLELRNGLTRIRLVWQKCCTDVCWKNFNFFCGTLSRNPPNIAILPVKSPFHKTHGSHFVPILVDLLCFNFFLSSSWNKSSRRSQDCF